MKTKNGNSNFFIPWLWLNWWFRPMETLVCLDDYTAFGLMCRLQIVELRSDFFLTMFFLGSKRNGLKQSFMVKKISGIGTSLCPVCGLFMSRCQGGWSSRKLLSGLADMSPFYQHENANFSDSSQFFRLASLCWQYVSWSLSADLADNKSSLPKFLSVFNTNLSTAWSLKASTTKLWSFLLSIA